MQEVYLPRYKDGLVDHEVSVGNCGAWRRKKVNKETTKNDKYLVLN